MVKVCEPETGRCRFVDRPVTIDRTVTPGQPGRFGYNPVSIGRSAMDMKHAPELSLIESCPIDGSVPIDVIAYRFVFGGADHEKNFTCPSKLNPRRTFNLEHQCSSLALSFYTNKEAARSAYSGLLKLNKNIGKLIGDSIAELKVVEDDGLAGPVDGTGHFDLWESATATFDGRIIGVEALAS